MNKEPSENKKSTWKLKIELLKLQKKKSIEGLENKVKEVFQKEKQRERKKKT